MARVFGLLVGGALVAVGCYLPAPAAAEQTDRGVAFVLPDVDAAVPGLAAGVAAAKSKGRSKGSNLKASDSRARCKKKKKCTSGEQSLNAPDKKDGQQSASTAVGGGFGYLAPWPSGKTLVVGRPCGLFARQSTHRDYGGRWGDDRFSVDLGVCGPADFRTPVLAAHDGVVRLAYFNAAYGKTVLLEAPGGLATRYAHLDRTTVSPGQLVKAGEQIGTLGHSGAGGGGVGNSHLHFVAYKGRGSGKGTLPSPMAGVHLCNGCLVTSATGPATDGLPFLASMEGQFPMDESGRVVVSPGQSTPFGFTLHFNQDFKPSFVLEPDTPGTIARFSSATGPIGGTPFSHESQTAAYRGMLHIPADTPPGEYDLAWLATNNATGQLGNLRPSLTLVVMGAPPPSPAAAGSVGQVGPPSLVTPLPETGPAPTEVFDAEFVSLDTLPAAPPGTNVLPADTLLFIAPGETGTVAVRLKNKGQAVWYPNESSVQLGTLGVDGDPPIAYVQRTGPVNAFGNRVALDGPAVGPGGIATFRFSVRLDGQAGAKEQKLQLVRDGVPAARFGPQVTIRTLVADETHMPAFSRGVPGGSQPDCTWQFVHQTGSPLDARTRLIVDDPMRAPAWQFVLRNNSRLCPWFRLGSNPFRLGAHRPYNRTSSFYVAGSPSWASPDRLALPSDVRVVLPGQTASFAFPLKAKSTVPRDCREYFNPLFENLYWLAPIDGNWLDFGMHVPIKGTAAELGSGNSDCPA